MIKKPDVADELISKLKSLVNVKNQLDLDTLASIILNNRAAVVPYLITETGQKYYDDLKAKYMLRTKMRDEKIVILLVLHEYALHPNEHDYDTAVMMVNEICETYGIRQDDPKWSSYTDQVFTHLLKSGYVKKNPTFNYDLNRQISEKLKTLVLTQ